jgi:Fimbrial assembly protein (PilN)
VVNNIKKPAENVQKQLVAYLTSEHAVFGIVEQLNGQSQFRWRHERLENINSGSASYLNEEALLGLLKQIAQEEKLQNASLRVVLGGEHCVTRVCSGTREQVHKELSALEYRSTMYLSLGHGQKVFASSVFSLDAKRDQAALTVANEKTLTTLLHAAKEAGYKLECVEHSLVALSRAMGKLGLDAASPVLIAEIKKGCVDLGVSYRGRLLLDYRPGGCADLEQSATVILKHLGRIQRYCARNFQLSSNRIDQVMICGPSEEAAALQSYFTTAEKLKSEYLDPRTIQPEWRMEKVTREESWLSPILGTTIDPQNRTDSDGAPDLMAPARLLQREPLVPGLVKNAWPLAAAMLLTAIMYGIGWYENMRVAGVEKLAAEAKANEDIFNAQKLELGQIDSKIKYINVIGKNISPPVWENFLLDLGECLPEGTWLEAIRVERDGSVSMSGPSYDENSVFELVEKLKKVPALSNVAIEGTRSARLETGPATLFEIKATYNVRNENEKGS